MASLIWDSHIPHIMPSILTVVLYIAFESFHFFARHFLLIDQKLSPGVVNVLISYCLKINNEKLNKSYVETIAGQWKRLNIDTVEEAMKITEKEHKKIKKKVVTKKVKEEKLPAWFDKKTEVEKTTQEDQEEIENILKELI